MKKNNRKALLVFCAITFCVAIFVAGCMDKDRSGSTIDEPELTVDYLSGEYAQQLLRDDAACIYGTIEVTVAEDGTAMIKIASKQYVEDASKPNGYYIADRNLEYDYPLSFQARATFLSGGTSIAKVMTADEFVSAVRQDFEEYGASNPEYQKYKLYDIYIINDQIELLIARYLP